MLKIYNTMSKTIEDFLPQNKNEVKMYVCGPTVYSHIHIGNARPVIFFDMLRSYLEFINYKVNYVSNITDIDDKIIDEAIKQNITEKELTETFTEAFIQASKSVGSNLPDLMPKATTYIESMITYIENLIENKFAYVKDSGVYFDTSKISNYGSLSGQKINDLSESVRILNNTDKLDFKDFTLWKKTTEGISFKSPWGSGRPGWHTECAVMNDDIFDGMIDIHGGGSDLIFPHHENENAQTIAHNNHGLSKYWMHVGRVDFDSIKMSKSLGNTVLVKDLEDPISYRLLILAHHYRTPINYSEELRVEFVEMYDKIVRTLKRTSLKIGIKFNKDLINQSYIDKFIKEMNNDLNTPNAITIFLELVKELNKNLEQNVLVELFNTLILLLNVFNLNPTILLTEEIVNKYKNWEQARANKDFKLADEIRKDLLEEGWI